LKCDFSDRKNGLQEKNTFAPLALSLYLGMNLDSHGGNMNWKELRHDRHTVSLLTDHMVFAPKYRGKMLVGDVAMICEGIICKTCVEMDIQS